MNCIVLFLNPVLCCQSFQSVPVYNFANMPAMSYRSDLFASSCRVNIWEPAVYFNVLLISTVSRVGLPSFLIQTAMSDSKSLNISLLEAMISSKTEHVFLLNLSDLTLHIIFDTWWASMNDGSKWPIGWNNSRHAPSWLFYLHCRI